MLLKKKYLISVILLIYASSALYPQQSYKKLTIKGLKVFSEKYLYKELNLNRFEEGKIPLAEVINSIEKFYKEKHYTLVKVYSTDVRTSGEYALFVDEGRLGKIIVHNLNNYYSLKFKQQIDIPERIYNTEVLDQNLKNIKIKFPTSDVKTELQQPPDYEGNLIQLDRELQRLKLGEIFDTSFFDRYIPLHDLHFYVKNRNGDGTLNGKIEGIGFNIDYKYPSVFIPEIYYYDENAMFSKDHFEGAFFTGFDPGFGGLLRIPPSDPLLVYPSIKFIELTGEYKVSPMQNPFIGPLLRWRMYQSKASRGDLGITEYRYRDNRATLAPEFTILKNLNVYAGCGIDQVKIYRSKIDREAEENPGPIEDTYRNLFGEARLKFDPIPIRIGNRIDKYIVLTYTDFFSGNSSRKLEILAAYDTEFQDMSIFSFRSKTVLQFNNPPFYMTEGVNNQYFKGFSGDGYFTDKKLSMSCEYRFSIYQDFIYAGAFFDWVVFEPAGYILSGLKNGINTGPTARILIYDQFEFTIYLGFDMLFPDKTSGTNIQMKLTKKW